MRFWRRAPKKPVKIAVSVVVSTMTTAEIVAIAVIVGTVDVEMADATTVHAEKADAPILIAIITVRVDRELLGKEATNNVTA